MINYKLYPKIYYKYLLNIENRYNKIYYEIINNNIKKK